MTRGSPTFLPALSPWPATLTCPSLELRMDRASLSFSVWSWGALDSDVTQLSKLLQQGPLGPPGAAVRVGTVRSSGKSAFLSVLFVHTSMYDLFAQRPLLFLKHFENPWLNEARALPLQRITLFIGTCLPNTLPQISRLPPGLITVAPRL